VQPCILELPHFLDRAVLSGPQGAVDQLAYGVGLDAHSVRDLGGADPGQLEREGLDPASTLPLAPGVPDVGVAVLDAALRGLVSELFGQLRNLGQDRSELSHPLSLDCLNSKELAETISTDSSVTRQVCPFLGMSRPAGSIHSPPMANSIKNGWATYEKAD